MSAKDSALTVAPEFMVEDSFVLPSLAAAQQADEGARTHSELRGDPPFSVSDSFHFLKDWSYVLGRSAARSLSIAADRSELLLGRIRR